MRVIVRRDHNRLHTGSPDRANCRLTIASSIGVAGCERRTRNEDVGDPDVSVRAEDAEIFSPILDGAMR